MSASNQRVLVLGGNGFLGQHVVQQLGVRGHEPVVASRRTGVDLRDLSACQKLVADIKPDTIVNCAAHVGSVHYVTSWAADVVTDNLLMLVNMYKAAQTAAPDARIINPISNCSYPGAANVHKEDAWFDGAVHGSVLAYGTPRRMIYVLAESFRKQHGTRSVNWLVSNAYGPGDHLDPNKVHALNGIVMRMIQGRRTGNTEFSIWGSGKPVREWVYIVDVARMLALSVEAEDEQTYPVNLAQNKAWSIAEIAEIAANLMGYDVEFTFDTSKTDGAPIKILDDESFRSKWPDFAFTPLEEGVRNTIAYYEEALV